VSLDNSVSFFRGNPSNGNITRNDHDLILLKLQNRVRLTNRVQYIRLPNFQTDKFSPVNRQQCVVSGFGAIRDTRQSSILKYLTVPIVEREEWYSNDTSLPMLMIQRKKIDIAIATVHVIIILVFYLVHEVIELNVSKTFIYVLAIGMAEVTRVMVTQGVHWLAIAMSILY
jgi:hypothetical protein